MSKWVVVSFFTTGTGYEDEVKKLEASLNEFKIDYHLFPCEPRGSWRRNLDYKSQIILEAFDMFPGTDIVFIDADGVVRQYPKLFDKLSNGSDSDLAAHFHPYQGTTMAGGSLLSGTLWFRNSDRGRKIVGRWHDIGLGHQAIRHQHCLRVAINELKKEQFEVKVYRLPREYTLIFDYYRRERPRPQPVVEHFQASRRLRRHVGYGGRLMDSSFSTLEQKERKENIRRARTRVRLNRMAVKKRRMLTTESIIVERKYE